MNPTSNLESSSSHLPQKPTSSFVIEPMEGAVTLANIMENLLKHPGRLLHACQSGGTAVGLRLLAIMVISLVVFGLLLGSFSGGTQLWAAPLKITISMLIAVMICLPSLYIFSSLDGLNARLHQIVSTLLCMVALSGLLMLGFAPVLWVFSTSTESLGFMGFLALLFWVIGLYFGIRLLLGAASSLGLQSKSYLRLWIILFTTVTLQMSTSLRPLIGTADTLLPIEKRFFVQHWLHFLDSENPPL